MIVPKPIAVDAGKATLTLDPAFAAAVEQMGTELTALAPARRVADVFTLPARSGRVNRTGTRARIRHRGGMRFELLLGAGEGYVLSDLRLLRLDARITGRRLTVFVRLSGDRFVAEPVPFFRGRGTGVRTGNRYRFTVDGVRLTTDGAEELGGLANPEAAAGDVVGSAKLVARKRSAS